MQVYTQNSIVQTHFLHEPLSTFLQRNILINHFVKIISIIIFLFRALVK